MSLDRLKDAAEGAMELASEHDDSGFSSEDDAAFHDAQEYELDEKDSDEEELERLVLGDSATFREQLFNND